MSDQPNLMQFGGMVIGPTPEPHIPDFDRAAADVAWRQSHGSLSAYHMLLDEHAAGTINLLAKDQTRLTGPDAPEIPPGDPRFTATGGEVYGGPPGQTQVLPPGTGPQPQTAAENVSPLSEDERNMLADLRAKPEAELTQSEAANLRALSDRDEALSKPLTAANKRRLTMLRNIGDNDRTPEQSAELAALAAREGVE